jgi:hypothetical protein
MPFCTEFELFILINLHFVVYFLHLQYLFVMVLFINDSQQNIHLKYSDHFIANAKFRSISGGRIGLSVRAVANYTNFRIVFKDFDIFLSGTISFTELNKTNLDAFKH